MIRPFVTNRMALNLAKEVFSLSVNESSSSVVKELNSPEARCFYIRGSLPQNKKIEHEFTLKICKFEEFQEVGIIDELNDVMIHVSEHGIPCSVPQQTVRGELYDLRKLTATPVSTLPTLKTKKASESSVYDCVVRLLSYIPGQNMRDISCGLPMFYQVGHLAAEMDKVLKDFKCPMLQTRSPRWDLNNLPLATKVSYLIQDPHHKQLLQNVENLFHTEIHPKLDSLPKQCIHADINETNLIFSNSANDEPTGVIDFDLASYNCRVFEISACAAYMMTMHLEEPVKAGAYTVAGYQLNNPLSTEESDLIFYLIQNRLYLSVCYGTLASQLHPKNSEYLLYTVQRAWKVLEKLSETSKSEFDEKWQDLCRTRLKSVSFYTF